jgi:hypothetical protein
MKVNKIFKDIIFKFNIFFSKNLINLEDNFFLINLLKKNLLKTESNSPLLNGYIGCGYEYSFIYDGFFLIKKKN